MLKGKLPYKVVPPSELASRSPEIHERDRQFLKVADRAGILELLRRGGLSDEEIADLSTIVDPVERLSEISRVKDMIFSRVQREVQQDPVGINTGDIRDFNLRAVMEVLLTDEGLCGIVLARNHFVHGLEYRRMGRFLLADPESVHGAFGGRTLINISSMPISIPFAGAMVTAAHLVGSLAHWSVGLGLAAINGYAAFRIVKGYTMGLKENYVVLHQLTEEEADQEAETLLRTARDTSWDELVKLASKSPVDHPMGRLNLLLAHTDVATTQQLASTLIDEVHTVDDFERVLAGMEAQSDDSRFFGIRKHSATINQRFSATQDELDSIMSKKS